MTLKVSELTSDSRANERTSSYPYIGMSGNIELRKDQLQTNKIKLQ